MGPRCSEFWTAHNFYRYVRTYDFQVKHTYRMLEVSKICVWRIGLTRNYRTARRSFLPVP